MLQFSTLHALTDCRFVQEIMLFGMGINLSDEDDEIIRDIVAPAYAVFALTNDYFSFDREYGEWREGRRDSMDPEPMTNAVWHCMQWYNIDIEQSKELVRTETVRYEAEFESRKRTFLDANPSPPQRLWMCLDGISQMIIGNVIWSSTCPRYHPELRYDANAGVENRFLGRRSAPSVEEVRAVCPEKKAPDQRDFGVALSKGGDYFDARGWSECSSEAVSPMSGSRQSNMPTHAAIQPSDKEQLLRSELVLDPFNWCSALPSKNIRNMLIDALNIWLKAPKPASDCVKAIIGQLHNASLLLDDIEDCSPLRRGQPAAHTIFGVGETINSANFTILETMDKTRSLPDPERSLDIFVTQLRLLFIGQSHDLRWTRHNTCPSEQEYMEMVDRKTGGLFRLLTGLLEVNAPRQSHSALLREDLDRLVTLAGRLFQIRDDYQNLTSAECTDQKGFCEDLDEGKLSYPMVYALTKSTANTSVLRSVMATRARNGSLSREMKLVVLNQLKACGSFDATKEMLAMLHKEVEDLIGMVESTTGCKNWVLRLIIRKLIV